MSKAQDAVAVSTEPAAENAAPMAMVKLDALVVAADIATRRPWASGFGFANETFGRRVFFVSTSFRGAALERLQIWRRLGSRWSAPVGADFLAMFAVMASALFAIATAHFVWGKRHQPWLLSYRSFG